MSIVKSKSILYFFKLKKGNINKPFENISKDGKWAMDLLYAALSHLAFK
jgi:hypothetical protein